MSQENANTFLEREPVGRLMGKYAVPCIISLLVAALYNIVDQIFIANADYLGSNGNAANTVVFPLTVVALAVAVMIGDGCCAFASISLGARDEKRAGNSIGSAVVLSVVSGFVITALYFLLLDPLLTLFGGHVNDETFKMSIEYFIWIAAGIPFYVFGQAMNPVIRSDGSPKFAMVSTLAGAALNIVLDPLFIFVFRWGMMGAAVATILGQILTAVLSVWYLRNMKAVKLTRENFRLHPALMRKYLPLGICSFLSQISLVASMAAVNNMVHQYGALDPIFGQAEFAQIPMAVIGIVMKFFQIVISIVVGMAAGCIPIVGFNVGADRPDRARKILTCLLTSEVLVGVAALLIVEFLPARITALFGAASESVYYSQFAVRCFRVYLCMVVFACVNKAAFIFLQSLGKPWVSTGLSMVREIVFGVGLTVLMPLFWGLDGVLWSMPLSDALTFIISLVVIIMAYRELGVKQTHLPFTPIEESIAVTPTHLERCPIIVIGRSFGAGGRSVGKGVAEALSIPYYDKEILSEAARQGGLSEKYLETLDEMPTSQGGRGNIVTSDRPFESPTSLALRLQQQAVESIASKGACVFVGRRADKIVREMGLPLLSVFVTAPIEKRIERVARRDAISVEQAGQKIQKADREREEYYNTLSSVKWANAATYDLCLDTGALGVEGAVQVITAAAGLIKGA